MNHKNIVHETRGEGVHLITVNRPESRNALNRETILEIDVALSAVAEDKNAKILLVTGAGDKAFIAGADIKEVLHLNPLHAKEFSTLLQGLVKKLELLPVPSIAVVNGFCLGGGCELAMGCSWIMASERAVFGLPEVMLGVIPGAGGTQRLSRLVGVARALELVTTGRVVTADEALDFGLVNSVHAAGELMTAALEVADTVAGNCPSAVQMTKKALIRCRDMTLLDACDFERESFGCGSSQQECAEAPEELLKKQKASLKGE